MEYICNIAYLDDEYDNDYRLTDENNMILLRTSYELIMINPEDGSMNSIDRNYNIGDSVTFNFECPVTLIITKDMIDALNITNPPEDEGVTIDRIQVNVGDEKCLVQELDTTVTPSELTALYVYKINSMLHEQSEEFKLKRNIKPDVWRIVIGDSPIYSFISYYCPKVIKCREWYYIFARLSNDELEVYRFKNGKM